MNKTIRPTCKLLRTSKTPPGTGGKKKLRYFTAVRQLVPLVLKTSFPDTNLIRKWRLFDNHPLYKFQWRPHTRDRRANKRTPLAGRCDWQGVKNRYSTSGRSLDRGKGRTTATEEKGDIMIGLTEACRVVLWDIALIDKDVSFWDCPCFLWLVSL